MSPYTKYYNKYKLLYRTVAKRWKEWADDYPLLTEEEKRGMKLYFRSIAIRFGLVTEFRHLGLID